MKSEKEIIRIIKVKIKRLKISLNTEFGKAKKAKDTFTLLTSAITVDALENQIQVLETILKEINNSL